MGGRSCFITSGAFGHGLLLNLEVAMECVEDRLILYNYTYSGGEGRIVRISVGPTL